MTPVHPAAKSGLLDRRRFIARGLPVLGGVTLAAQASDTVQLAPEWTREPGGADVPYGERSGFEAGVVRQLSADSPGFAIWRTPLDRLRGHITPNSLHFAVHHNGIPDIAPQRHQLVLHGLVERPLRFDLERLERYPMHSRIHFLECSGNTAANALSPFAKDLSVQELSGEVSSAEWTGVPLSVLLREAGVKPKARWAIIEGADGGTHQRSLPMHKLMDDAIVALYQNGERLRPSQGYPMRLFVPGWEGNVNVKWLHRIELSDVPAHTKDEAGMYTEVLADGRIRRFSFTMEVKSLITHPSGRQHLPQLHGFHEISGLAWSGDGRIARVEISTDGGRQWHDARLEGPVLSMAFTRFSLPWRWDGRAAILMSRAHDEHGRVQPTRAAWKKRFAAHTFNHYNAIQAWRIHNDGRVENVYA
ncbi:MAG: sulfite dehydrogenase [Comamonadaceae bacterium]|nr:sulfite dehydrogenase [Comamonadaceae bacterium]